MLHLWLSLTQRIELNKSVFDLAAYKRGLASVEEQLVFYKKNEVVFYDQIDVLKRDASFRESEIIALNLQLEKLKKEKESNHIKIDNFENASKSLDKLIGSQITDNSKTGLGFTSYNAVAPLPTGLFAPSTIDMSSSGPEEFKQPKFESYRPKASRSVYVDTLNVIKKASDALIIKDWVSDYDEDESEEMVVKSKNVQHTPEEVNQPRKNFAPTAVLTKFEIVPISTARQSSSRASALVSTTRLINTTAPKPIVNVAKTRQNAFQKTHSLSMRPFHQQIALKNRYLVNTAKVKYANTVNTVKGKSVTSAVRKQGTNAVKFSACWVWRPKIKVQDHVFKNSGSYIYKRFNYVDPEGRLKALIKGRLGIELKGYLLNDGYADLVQHADKKELAIPGQTATSKEFSNPLMAGSLPKTISAKFVDQHNMVAYLEKNDDNTEFHQIVDFLSSCSITYALTVSPNIYASYIEQFWNTASSKTVNSVKKIHDIVDGKAVVISESLVRSDLFFDDEDGITCLTNDEIFENLASMGYEPLSTKLTFQKDEAVNQEEGDKVEKAKTTDDSLETAQDSDNIVKTQTTAMSNVDIPREIDTSGSPRRQETMGGTSAKTRSERVLEQPNELPLTEGHTSGSREGRLEENIKLTDNVPTPYDSPLTGGYTPRSDEGRITLAELMETCITLSNRVTQLENKLSTTKVVYNKAFITLTNRVKKATKEVKEERNDQLSLDEELAQKLYAKELAKKGARQEQERYNLEKALELQRQLDQMKENVPKGDQAKEIDWNNP
nr:hypothetical protein [Tanacetum cinerariifolium]